MDDFIKSLSRGLQILKTFTPNQPMLRLQDITDITGLSKSTVSRYLKTLTSLNYIHVDHRSKRYYLGPEIMSLGFSVLSNMDLREVALPYMDELATASQQNVGLGILDRTEVVYIERIKKNRVMAIDVYVGSRINAYRSSIGRAILAFLSRKEMDRFIEESLKEKDAAEYLGPGGRVLMKGIDKIRRNGYAVSDGELIPGVRAIAAPILKSGGEVEGAINMPVMSEVVSRQELVKKYAPMLVDTARRISFSRGFISD